MWTSGSLASCQCTEMQQHMNPLWKNSMHCYHCQEQTHSVNSRSTEFLPMMLGKELMRGFWVDPEKYGRAFHLLLVHTVSLFQFHLSISNHGSVAGFWIVWTLWVCCPSGLLCVISGLLAGGSPNFRIVLCCFFYTCRSTLWVRVSQYSIGLRTYCFWHQSDVIDQCWPVIVVYGSVLHLILDSTWVWYGLLPELKILTLVWHWDYFLCPRRSWTRCIVKLILSKWWEHS